MNESVEATSDLLDDNFFQISIKKLTTKYAYNEKDLWSLEFRPKRTPLYLQFAVQSNLSYTELMGDEKSRRYRQVPSNTVFEKI